MSIIECKGRNGYFKFGDFHVWTVRPLGDEESEAYVEIRSARSGKSSPIVVKGPVSEVSELFNRIATRIMEEEMRIRKEFGR